MWIVALLYRPHHLLGKELDDRERDDAEKKPPADGDPEHGDERCGFRSEAARPFLQNALQYAEAENAERDENGEGDQHRLDQHADDGRVGQLAHCTGECGGKRAHRPGNRAPAFASQSALGLVPASR